MLTKTSAERILKETLALGLGDGMEVILDGDRTWFLQFSGNQVRQNLFQKDYILTVRVVVGKREGVVTTNRFAGEDLKRAVEAAYQTALQQKEDPEMPDLPAPTPVPEQNPYDNLTIESSPYERAEMVKIITSRCLQSNLLACGALSSGDRIAAVANSKGAFCYHSATHADMTLTVLTPGGASGWSESHSWKLSELNVDHLMETAIEKARRSENPVAPDMGHHTVVLEERAVANLLSFLSSLGCGALSVQEEKSFMTGKLGEKLTGDKITVLDDCERPEILGMPFDCEAVQRQRVTLIEEGVARGVVYDLKTAKKEGRSSTGHALHPPRREGPDPHNLVMLPGTSSTDEMVSGTRKGILVTRFWYDNVVDSKKTLMTGLSRDGTFLIENGKIAGAVGSLRYNESILGAFSRAQALGRDLKSFSFGTSHIACPSMLIEDFCFTGSREKYQDW